MAVARLGTEVNAVSCGASTGSRLAVSDVASRGARLSSIVAAWAFSMPGEPKAASQPAIQPARRNVPLNAARAANRCALISPIVSSLSSKAAHLGPQVPPAKYIVNFWLTDTSLIYG